MIKYSAIVPNWNHGPYLHKCISSVFDTGYEDVEVIVYDNVSTDNSEEVVKSFTDPRVKWMQAPAHYKSPSRSINRAMEVATGEVAFILNADDYVLDNYFKTSSLYFKNPKVGFVSIGVLALEVDGTQRVYMPPKLSDTDLGNIIYTGNKVFPPAPFRKQMFFDIGGMDETMIFFDWDFWIRALVDGCGFKGWQYRICDKALSFRRIHDASMTDHPVEGKIFKDSDEWYKFAIKQVQQKYIEKGKDDSVIQKFGTHRSKRQGSPGSAIWLAGTRSGD